MTTPPTSALVVGAGPAGLSAALFLTERGVPVRIVDAADGPTEHSRAFGVNARSLELLESTGVTADLLGRGRRAGTLNIWRGRQRLVRLHISRAGHRHPYILILSQRETEAALVRALQERDVAVEWGTRVTDVEADLSPPEATLETPDGVEAAGADLVVGADGAHSTVREALGVTFEGDRWEEPWRLWDARIATALQPEELHAFLLPEGAGFMVRIAGDVWRVVGPSADVLERLPGESRVHDVGWRSEFHISHRVASAFGRGPVHLVGDAAHIHSPVGGRGMNLGIEDGWVLAWLASEGRLGEYEERRRPVVEDVVRTVRRTTEVLLRRSRGSRIARRAVPVLGPLAVPFFGERLRRWVLGVDHPVGDDGPGPLAGFP